MKKLEDGRYTLDIDSDLTALSLGQAHDFILHEFLPVLTRNPKEYSHARYILEVASQSFEECFVYVYFCNATISLNTKYSPFEWSLTGELIYSEKGETKTRKITVWSPGA